MDPSRKRKKLEKIWTVGTNNQMPGQRTVTVHGFLGVVTASCKNAELRG